LSNFDCIPNLQVLFLSNNRVTETLEIEKMKLPNLVEFSLGGNAVCRKSLYRLISILQFPQVTVIDGKEVAEEERKRAHVHRSNAVLSTRAINNERRIKEINVCTRNSFKLKNLAKGDLCLVRRLGQSQYIWEMSAV
jgi:hypothetical protein